MHTPIFCPSAKTQTSLSSPPSSHTHQQIPQLVEDTPPAPTSSYSLCPKQVFHRTWPSARLTYLPHCFLPHPCLVPSLHCSPGGSRKHGLVLLLLCVRTAVSGCPWLPLPGSIRSRCPAPTCVLCHSLLGSLSCSHTGRPRGPRTAVSVPSSLRHALLPCTGLLQEISVWTHRKHPLLICHVNR